MGVIVLAAYQAKPGKEKILEQLLSLHGNILRNLGFITEHRPYVMKAQNHMYLEVFEWMSEAAIKAAHNDPEVKTIWEKMAEVAEMVAPSTIQELQIPFGHFSPLDA